MSCAAAIGLLLILTVVDVGAVAEAPSAAAGALAPDQGLASAPGPAVDLQYNIVWTLTAGGAVVNPNNTVTLTNVSPAVTYIATVPTVHAGNLNTNYFLSNDVDQRGSWLGAPDVAIIGKDATGAEKVVLLAVDNPVLTATTAVFESIPLTPTKDAPIYKGGPVAAFLTELSNTTSSLHAAVRNIYVATFAAPVPLYNVSLVVDGMMVRNPAVPEPKATRALLQSASPMGSYDGFTFNCAANTPWRPVGCGPLMAPISHFNGWGGRRG